MHTALYLFAIILANLSAAYLGPWSTPVNAFLLVGLSITSRDHIHDTWSRDRLAARMAALIFTGSILSALISWKATRIALASTAAFAASATVDTLIYHRLRHLPRLQRVNVSNVGSALVDSALFPAIAFGALMPAVSALQLLAKVAGGALWAHILREHGA